MELGHLYDSFPQLETTNLVLRRITTSDSGDLFRILSDDAVTEFYDDATYTDPSQATEQIESWEFGYAHRRCVRWGIVRRSERVIIGTCGYYGFHPLHMRASIGYELARSAWRHGIMTEALTAIIDLGFGEVGINRIDAVVMPGNIPSVRLLEKLGFRNEGVLREYENWGEKGFVDLRMLSLLRGSSERSSDTP